MTASHWLRASLAEDTCMSRASKNSNSITQDAARISPSLPLCPPTRQPLHARASATYARAYLRVCGAWCVCACVRLSMFTRANTYLRCCYPQYLLRVYAIWCECWHMCVRIHACVSAARLGRPVYPEHLSIGSATVCVALVFWHCTHTRTTHVTVYAHGDVNMIHGTRHVAITTFACLRCFYACVRVALV